MTSPVTALSTAQVRDTIGAEWIKLRAVRSTYWTLLIAGATTLGLNVVVGYAFAQPSARSSARSADPMLPGFAGLEYAVLAVGVLGVLAFTSECATGLIRVTFAAVPRRGVVLTAKVLVVGLVTLVLGELIAFCSFFAVQAVLAAPPAPHLGVSLTAPRVLGAVLAEGTLLTVCALTGLALGAIIRHTAAAIAALAGLIYLPAVAGLLPAPWNGRISRFTLISAAHQVVTLRPSSALFTPAISMLVLLAWPVAVLLVAAILINRRDA